MPRDLSAFQIEASFNFSDAERRVIENRRGPALKLALALQIRFLRMTERLLEAVRIVPPALIGRIAATRTEGINLRGVFSFPIEQYAEQLLSTLVATKSRAVGA